ncbi:retroviral-like aspartic protease family protein [Chryseobacterium antibioticum]|uniref:Retroviral-like aspartic protease family protein n=1 Tax=Chryseobacterium pyrolae TaxID=2987481 RepID=A0ABT2ILX0_9FLAO|nr:retropepsin-like aspartic protease [Chryseobacterium pyrolae]MCT2409373.1 retroviral-like aspartic protease family protein [Chryseobacterium pyrolae]
MKKILYSLLILSTTTFSAQGKKFFKSGEVQLQNPVEKINLRYANDLPFVQVMINGKSYNFLFDTGAPTVISTAVYAELGLEKKHKSTVKDSQKNKHEQIFTILPEMTVDKAVFQDVGAVVMDFSVSELSCFRIDGILGANQMAKLFWKINYSENSLEASKDLAQFNPEEYDIVIPFSPRAQKTPVVETDWQGKKVDITFDTGFSGRLKITDKVFDAQKVIKSVEVYGTSSVGAYGAGKPALGYIFRTADLSLGNKNFSNEIIATGNASLIGNEFFKNFIFILDWSGNKIYMKRIKNEPAKLESFGFGYRFVDSKPTVAFVFQEENFPLKVGDSIISINNINLDSLDKDGACHYFLNRVESGQSAINVKIRRAGKEMEVKLEKKEFLGV